MQRLLGVVVSVCLVLQPLVVLLHLALEGHTHGHADAVTEMVAHHHHGHAHHHPHVHAHAHPHGADVDLTAGDEDDDSHPPHPAEDHLCQEQDQLPAPSSFDFHAQPAFPVGDLGDWDIVITERPVEATRRVRDRPPPRALAQPRAPPAIV